LANIFERSITFLKNLKQSLSSALPAWCKPWLGWALGGLVVLTILLGIGGILFVSSLAVPGRMIEAGDQAYWKSHLVEAESNYQEALDSGKFGTQKSRAYARLCRLYRVQGDRVEALRMCQAAVQADPKNALAEAELAQTYSDLSVYDEALAHAQTACELDETNYAGFAALAKAMALEGQLDGRNDTTRPLEMAQYAYSLDPTNPEVLEVLGLIFSIKGGLEEAYGYYLRASLLQPEFFAYYINLGEVELARMNLATALEYFEEALEKHPESVSALQGRGWAWSLTGDYNKASKDFLQALRYAPGEAESWAGLGWIYLRQENLEAAERAFNQALGFDPVNANALAGLDNLKAIEAAAAEVMAEAPEEPTVQTEAATNLPETVDETGAVVENDFSSAASAAVMVYAFNDQMDIVSACSGVNILSRGVILTTAHCLGHAESMTLYNAQGLVGIGVVHDFKQPPEKLLRAKVVQTDFTLDIAALEVIGDWQGNALVEALNLPFVTPGDSEALQVGDEVWTAGFPGMGGETLTITRGVISGFSSRDGTPWIKTDLMTGSGNSGGMVVNADNELVAIHVQSWLETADSGSHLSAERPLSAISSMIEPYLAEIDSGQD